MLQVNIDGKSLFRNKLTSKLVGTFKKNVSEENCIVIRLGEKIKMEVEQSIGIPDLEYEQISIS
jgi:hypothetical protein